ncbi:NUDIX domain-containing protein [Agromyces allii]|uniref:NUDIX domain-containing protein n=1 Tax=Agromyces allii TaxID=393607 RepID=A0ABN2PZN1_9MICO|nr:NUDIX domain-containing protein [Agromyces allii]
MVETSAGILLHRRRAAASGPRDGERGAEHGLEVLLGHMGGPFWQGRDEAAWSIPKGGFTDEAPLDAALREFAEELGAPAPDVPYVELGVFRYTSGKTVAVFTGEAEFDASAITSNTFELEWPPRSGRRQSFPEFDSAAWMPVADARARLVKGQRPALDALLAHLA